MTYKNRFLVLVLCTFIGNVNASEANLTEEDSLEVVSKAEMEELKQLLKVLDSEEFVGAVQILADAMVESSKIVGDSITKASKEFGVEAAKKWADKKTEETKSAQDALIKSYEKFGGEIFRQWKPVLWALVALYAAKSIRSVIDH